MGRDKALLPWRRGTMIEAVLAVVRQAGAEEITISGSPERYGYLGVRCVPDRWAECGPLAGIASALAASTAPRQLMLGCDMPLVPPELLRWLWNVAGPEGGWVVPALEPGRFEPLCAIYDRALLSVIEAALAEGEFKIDRALAGAPRRTVAAAELAAAGFTAAHFRNLNRPDEYEAARPSR